MDKIQKKEEKIEELPEEEIDPYSLPLMTFYYTGSSMGPTFNEGDMVDCGRYKDIDDVKTGDIIIVKPEAKIGNRESGKYVVHRVVEITKNKKVKTQGDNNSQPDTWELDLEDIQGKIINAETPQRIQKSIIHNQYSKQSRDLCEEIMNENVRQKEELKNNIDNIDKELKNTKEYTALFDSKIWVDYLQAMADLQQAEKDKEEGLISEEQFEKVKEEYDLINETTTGSKIYKDYFALPLHSDLQEAYRASKLFEYDMTKIEHDSPEIREKHTIQGFPVAVIDIPKYIDFDKNIMPQERKYLQKVQSVEKITAFEEKYKDRIKRLIGTEKVDLDKGLNLNPGIRKLNEKNN